MWHSSSFRAHATMEEAMRAAVYDGIRWATQQRQELIDKLRSANDCIIKLIEASGRSL